MADRISSAEQFFKEIVGNAHPASFLRGLVTAPPSVYENDWCDFKGGERFNDADAKKLWSEALSGFANTGGGVLVWGIIAKDDGTGVDAANAISLLAEPAQVRSRLMQLHHQATDPPVLGVDVRDIVGDPASGAGFVVCYVPEGTSKPHRAEYKTNKPYYIRAGDDFIVPSPALLRTLFFPETRSDLVVYCNVDRKGMTDKNSARCFISIENRGPATVEDLAIKFVVDKAGCSDICFPDFWRASKTRQDGSFQTYYFSLPIHPGDIAESIYFVITTHASIAKIDIAMFARNQPPKRASLSIGDRDIGEGNRGLSVHASPFDPWENPLLY